MMSGTLLSFDFGTKSIGVAVGQRITGTARPLPAIKAQDGTPDWNSIERLLKEWLLKPPLRLSLLQTLCKRLHTCLLPGLYHAG